MCPCTCRNEIKELRGVVSRMKDFLSRFGYDWDEDPLLPPPITPFLYQQPSRCTVPPVLPPYSFQTPPFPYHLPTIAQLPSNPELPPPSLVPQCHPTASNTQTEDSFKLSKVQLDSLRSQRFKRQFCKELINNYFASR